MLADGLMLGWAKLMRRSLSVDPFYCPKCGSELSRFERAVDLKIGFLLLYSVAGRQGAFDLKRLPRDE